MYDLLIHDCHALVPDKDGMPTVRRNQDIIIDGGKIEADKGNILSTTLHEIIHVALGERNRIVPARPGLLERFKQALIVPERFLLGGGEAIPYGIADPVTLEHDVTDSPGF